MNSAEVMSDAITNSDQWSVVSDQFLNREGGKVAAFFFPFSIFNYELSAHNS